MTKENDMSKVYPRPTLALIAINAMTMVMWRKFVPANSKPSIWVEQQCQEWEGTQGEVVYLGNEGSDFDDATE